LKVNGKQLRRRKLNWKGSDRAAMILQNELLLELQEISSKEKTSPSTSAKTYSTYGKIVEDYINVRKPSDILQEAFGHFVN
jgi:hypothetical protein